MGFSTLLVGNEEAREYNDPYIRIVQLFDDGAAGLEVAAYFLIMISLCFAAFLWLVKQQDKLLNSSSKSSMLIENRQLSIVLLIATIALGIWMGSTAVTFVGGALMFLLIKGDSEKPPAAWVFGGVFLMLFASWSWAATLQQSIIGMLLFLGPWLMSAEEEESPLTKLFNDTSVRMKVAGQFLGIQPLPFDSDLVIACSGDRWNQFSCSRILWFFDNRLGDSSDYNLLSRQEYRCKAWKRIHGYYTTRLVIIRILRR